MDYQWDWILISQSDNFKIEWIDEFPEINWDWEYISESRNFDISWLKKYPNKNCEYDSIISHYKLLPIEIIEYIPHTYFQYQEFSYLDNYEQECRKYMAAYKIKLWWKKILYNPRHRIGMNFINNSYTKLFNAF